MKRIANFLKKSAAHTAIVSAGAASLLLASCASSTPTQHGAVTGGIIGAVVGGVAGDSGGDVAAGAAIGAITGAVAGRVYENEQAKYRYDPALHGGDNAEVQPLSPQPRTYSQPPANDPQPRRTYPQPRSEPEPDYPWARAADRPGHVISPHPPYNLINVEGFSRGDLAIDPTTGKVFRVP